MELESVLSKLKQKQWNEPRLIFTLRILPNLQTSKLLKKADAISELRYLCVRLLTEPEWCHAPDSNRDLVGYFVVALSSFERLIYVNMQVHFYARVSEALRNTYSTKEKIRSKALFRALDLMMQSKCGNVMWSPVTNSILDLLRTQLFGIASKRPELILSVLQSCEKGLRRLCSNCSCESCGKSSGNCIAASHAIHLVRFNAELSCHTRDDRLMKLMMLCSIRVFELGASLAKKKNMFCVLEESMKSFRRIGETFSEQDERSSSIVKSFLPSDDECRKEVVRYVHRSAASSSVLPDVLNLMSRRVDFLQERRAKRRKIVISSPSSSSSDAVNEKISSAFHVLSGLMRGLNAKDWNMLPLEKRSKLRRLVGGLEKKIISMGG